MSLNISNYHFGKRNIEELDSVYCLSKILFTDDTLITREPTSENCLDFIFAAFLCEKVIIVPDTNYITSAITKFMLDMPSPGSLKNIGVLRDGPLFFCWRGSHFSKINCLHTKNQ